MVTVSHLKRASKRELQDINNLLKQLLHDIGTYEPVSFVRFRQIVSDGKTIVVVIRNQEQIIGIGILFIVNKFRGRYGYIEDMIVDTAYRGRGLGKKLGQKLIAIARARKLKTLELSTRPSRVPANNLYKKLGFEHKKTNVYRLRL